MMLAVALPSGMNGAASRQKGSGRFRHGGHSL